MKDAISTSGGSGHVDIKIFGEAEADPGDLATLRDGLGRLRATDAPNANAAVGTYRRVVLNYFATVVAVHG